MGQLVFFIYVSFSINLKQLNSLTLYYAHHKNLKRLLVQKIFFDVLLLFQIILKFNQVPLKSFELNKIFI
jgi:hypothetical protein